MHIAIDRFRVGLRLDTFMDWIVLDWVSPVFN